jgi:hypothetical protein
MSLSPVELGILSRVCGQLEHYVNNDGREDSAFNNKKLLEQAMKILVHVRDDLFLERDFGHSQSDN